jgi:hypothetical protein
MTLGIGPASGWTAFALVPVAAVAGVVMRRFLRGRLVIRMRPHYVIGYAALGFAVVHVSLSMGGMAGADATGIWMASAALLGLCWQALLGTNLQSPGDYRRPLRRWHLVTFAAVLVLAGGHVMLDR